MTTYGYVRVSSTDQNEDRQMIALHQVGVEDIFVQMLVIRARLAQLVSRQ